MNIRLIIAQYPQSYPGQLMPSVVDAWDEFALEDNWAGYKEALAKHKAGVPRDYTAVRELVVHVPDEAVTSLFEDNTPVVEGTVV